jgi:hypothetical protein
MVAFFPMPGVSVFIRGGFGVFFHRQFVGMMSLARAEEEQGDRGRNNGELAERATHPRHSTHRF